jgi:hypothetical protein
MPPQAKAISHCLGANLNCGQAKLSNLDFASGLVAWGFALVFFCFALGLALVFFAAVALSSKKGWSQLSCTPSFLYISLLLYWERMTSCLSCLFLLAL